MHWEHGHFKKATVFFVIDTHVRKDVGVYLVLPFRAFLNSICQFSCCYSSTLFPFSTGATKNARFSRHGFLQTIFATL